MEYLDEVLIKEVTEAGIDRVFFVQNLPKHFIYRKVQPLITRYDRDGYTDGTQIPDLKAEPIDGLLDGLEMSPNRDGAVCFYINREASRLALQAIDAYISGTLPRDIKAPVRVPYPIDPTDFRSPARMREDIPLIELPMDDDDQVSRTAPQVSPGAKAPLAKPVRVLSEAEKQRRRDALAKARAVKNARKEEAKNA
jgi:hypothetical protein